MAAKGKGEVDTWWLVARSTGVPWRAPSDRRGSIIGLGTPRTLPFFGSSLLGLGRRDSTRSGRSSTRSSITSLRGSMLADGGDALQEVVVGGGEGGESSPHTARRSYHDGGGGGGGAPILQSPPSLRRAQTAPAAAVEAATPATPVHDAAGGDEEADGR